MPIDLTLHFADEPSIVHMPRGRFVGEQITLRASPRGPLNRQRIPELWSRVKRGFDEMGIDASQRVQCAVISGDLPPTPQPRSEYRALMLVDDPVDCPPGLVALEVPWGRMARFKHVGSPQFVGKTAAAAVSEWLPRMGERLREDVELFIYPPHYDRADPAGYFDYCVFV